MLIMAGIVRFVVFRIIFFFFIQIYIFFFLRPSTGYGTVLETGHNDIETNPSLKKKKNMFDFRSEDVVVRFW